MRHRGGAHKYTKATGGVRNTLKAPGASKKQLSEKTDVTNRNLAKKRVTPPGGVHSHTKAIRST